ncbi:hypothetical protein GCM10023175_32090 [Pseudonocardia xishanensis]|uniref:Uncharacterized protein n=1 Tax=Pseudonocardia xishanensis TaxID=630995 RepID=A0ABP8RTE1_9PSEU
MRVTRVVLSGRHTSTDPRGSPCATDPSPITPPDVAAAQRQLAWCQWAIPALTADMIVLSAVHGEQQRPGQQLAGILTTPGRWLNAAA